MIDRCWTNIGINGASCHSPVIHQISARNFAAGTGDILEKEEVVYDPEREEKEMLFD